MNEGELKGRLELAVEAGRMAGEHTLKYFHRPDLEVERKRDGTPVTVADREAEGLLRERIASAFPRDAIVGEEMADRPGVSGYRWILDPIDGTKSFIHGVPLYGTLVGVEHERRCVIGVIVLPGLDEYVYGACGLGAWHGRGEQSPVRARVSSVNRMSEALFCTTGVSGFVKENRYDVYEALRRRCQLTRGWGDCYGYVLVATGRAEIMIDPELSLWDMAALPAILEEAGGTFTDWQGTPTIYGKQGVATNGQLLSEVVGITGAK
ncbi:MAG TPA: histidinol-phosphatase [Phycisphaerae bacterium]|nr:histidinol-phosphatase [Phycisphaerae bacterium]HRY68576.1 histidinol-phosphatase [Phycisphaerae bacterium]HSA25625.1 histidinol-phosphatase [Phycisphaerae bacterium]